MMKYRLSFYGLTGFDTKGFDTQKEAIAWAQEQGLHGTIRPDKMMRYNPVKDEYEVIGMFKPRTRW